MNLDLKMQRSSRESITEAHVSKKGQVVYCVPRGPMELHLEVDFVLYCIVKLCSLFWKYVH